MPSLVAAVVCVLGIFGLFVLDRDSQSQTSKALWIPVVWLWIVGSREVSQWLAVFGIGHAGAELDSPDRYLSLESGSPPDRLVFTTLLVFGVVVLVSRGPEVGRLLRANLPILLFFLYCAVSVFWSDYPDVAFKRWLKAVGDVVMVTVVLTDRNPYAAVRRLLARTGFLLIPLSVLLIKYYPEVGKGFKHYGAPFYVGVTTNKNLLGIVCVIFGLGSLWRFLAAYQDRGSTHRTRYLVVHGTLLAMVLWLFQMAKSLTSLSCFLLAGGLMVATNLGTRARKPWVVHFLVTAVVLVSFSTLFFDVGGFALETMGKDPSLTGRTKIWDLVLGLSGNPLFGTGFESFWLGPRLERIWSVIWWHPNEAHNGYIEVYLNLGWIGLALLAVLVVTGYRNVLLVLRRDLDVGKLMLAYFVVGVVYNFTEAGFRMLNLVWITFLLAIMAVPGAWARTKTKSAVQLDPFSQQLAPPLEEVRPSCNL